MNFDQEIQEKIDALENLSDKYREKYPMVSLEIARAIQKLSEAKDKVLEKQKPDECVSPICENREPIYPVNRPRYCLECYRMKAS